MACYLGRALPSYMKVSSFGLRVAAVSNAVAPADILRCPVVVDDQAAVQVDVEADRWVRTSAVRMRHSDRARDPKNVVFAGTGVARGARVVQEMREMQTEAFAAAALSNRIQASASSFHWSQILALLPCLSHCVRVQGICGRRCHAVGPDYPVLGPSQALIVSDCLAGQRQLQGL